MAGRLLIVEKSYFAEENWQGLLSALETDYQFDAFTARQRLWGNGLCLLTHGTDQRLRGIADLLGRYGVTHWLLKPTVPKLTPKKVSALSVTSNAVSFICSAEEVAIARGDIVLAVLADLSGEVVDKGIKRLLLHHAYRGTTTDAGFSPDDLHLAILRGRPVLDLYLLTETYAVRDAVRLFPGRFNPEGLGDLAGYSATGNLRAVMELASSYAGEWHLRTDFGLANLPGCQLRKDDTENTSEKTNLISLTRFGWLMVDLLASSSAHRIATGMPPQPTLPDIGLSDLVHDSSDEPVTERMERAAGAPALLPPPGTEDSTKGWRWWKNQPYLALAPIVLFLLAAGMQLPSMRKTFTDSIELGVLPALISLFLGWQSFHTLHRKRQIENIPTSKIRSMAMGLVELHGRAVRRYALVSPMSHTPCVWYRLSKFRTEENGSRRSLGSSSSGPLPFFLDDETGRVLVNPDGAKICVQTHHEGSPSGGMLFTEQSFDSEEHWVEEVLAEGAWLYVLGSARPGRQAPASLKERLVERLRHLKSSEALQRFDSDGDGRINEDEWTAARRVVEHELLEEGLACEQSPRQNGGHAAIGRSPHRGFPFIIAEAASELQVAGRYGLHAALQLVASVGLGLWAILAWLKHYPV